MDVKSQSTDFFEDLSLERLHRRKSEKWSTYPADVLPAFVAEMDFALAPPVRQALESAIELGDCGYAAIDELAEAFAAFAAQRLHWSIDERAVFAVPDIMAGVTESLRALSEPDAGVVINPPVYAPFFEVIKAAGRRIVEVPLREHDGWDIDFDALERAFAGGAKAYLLCSPHNPVGRVWPRQDLEHIATLAREYGVAVVSDEVHAPLVMPGKDFVPFLQITDGDQPCIALSSASKAWNIAGLKCALMIAGSEQARAAVKTIVCANPTAIRWRIGHLGAIGSIAAFLHGGPWLDQLQHHLDRNRQLLESLLEQHIPNARYAPPQATYLGWVDCSALDLGSDPAARFLERGRVALEAGYKFGTQGRNYVRVNMGTSSGILTEIVRRMAAAQ